MACSILLPFWPMSTDCISWSKDNKIAVVGGESIAVLTPRLKDRANNGAFWDTTIIKVNGFTVAELPLQDPLSTANFSIGEELSLRQAVSAAWSHPGLAHRKGCALAVLTANHVLSIWAPVGKSNISANWKRRLVVNDAIKDYYVSLEQGNDNTDHQQRLERRQVQQRVRAFVWSSIRQHDPASDGLSCAGPAGEPVLIVSTEGGDILFLRVASPGNGANPSGRQWSANVAGAFNVARHVRSATSLLDQQLDLDLDDDKLLTADYLACDDVSCSDGDGSAEIRTLAFISDGKLFIAKVKTFSEESLDTVGLANLQSIKWYLRDRTDLAGPMRFAKAGEYTYLVVVGPDLVTTVNLTKDELVQMHDLDGRWDSVSGLAVSGSGDGNDAKLLHITSILSTSTTRTVTLPLPWEQESVAAPIEPLWRDAIIRSKLEFDAEHDLHEKLLERTCGIAGSPLHEFIASCITLHPADSIAYTIPANQDCVLNISCEHQPFPEGGSQLGNASRAWEDVVPAETILFSLCRHLERENGSTTKSPETISSNVLSFAAPSVSGHYYREAMSAMSVTTREDQLRRLRLRLYGRPEMRNLRASRIAAIALQQSPTSHHVRDLVRCFVAEVLQEDFAGFSMDETSMNIRRLYDIVLSKLDTTLPVGFSEATARDWTEKCIVCGEAISFESLKWARCTRGHQFARCALSFLAIQDPGVTKRCRICDQLYLDEVAVTELQLANEDVQMRDVRAEGEPATATTTDTWIEVSNSAPTLAQALFAACEICIYCGGTFE